ncbi:MAG TPA: SIS domain-containing protein [Acidimicrobiales bacterium]|nr:SIS domain-containing protein [Acidimicrobiales bacterium]
MNAPDDVLDTTGMWDVVTGFPEQVEHAAAVNRSFIGLPDKDEIEHVVVLGMGGSGIAGDLMTAVAGPFMPVPVVVTKGYEPPGFVGPTTLCFALSFSGDTEETLEAAQTAALAGARMVVVAKGGQLAQLAQSWDATLIGLPDGIPYPRAALGAMAIPTLLVLEETGLFPGASEWIDRAVLQLRRRRDQLTKPGNDAQELARRIGRTMPLVYGGGGLGAAAALRWKNEMNENPKVPSFTHTVPELMHNEIQGWAQHGDVTRQVFTLVLLRHDHEHPQVMRRFDLVRQWTEEVVAGVEEVHAEGDGALAQVLDLMFVGTITSMHMAAQEGVDPGPITVLEEIKAALAE